MTRRSSSRGPRPRPAATRQPALESARRSLLDTRPWTWLPPLLLIAAGLYAYHNGLHGPLVYDDLPAIRENPLIRTLWPPWAALSPPTTATLMQEVGRPTIIVSLAINYALGGLNVWGYHALNVAVHLLAALTLYGVVRRTLSTPPLRARYGPDAAPLALAVAAIWVVHPLATESVTYTIQRTESLMGLFFLTTLYAVIRASGSAQAAAWYAAAVVSCGLGMGSKEVMVVVPLVVLAYDRLFLSPSFREALRRRWALYAAFVAWIVLAALLSHRFRSERGRVDPSESWDYLKTQAGVIVHYLRLAVWPSGLVADYSDWPLAGSLVTALPAAIVVIALLTATAWVLHRRLPVAFLGIWFFLVLAPTSSVWPLLKEIVAERRMYLPLTAMIALVVIGGHTVIEACWSRVGWPTRWRELSEAGLVVLIAATLAQLTVARNDDYRSTTAFWNDVIAKRPGNARAHLNLGDYLYKQGQASEALARFQDAIRINPAYADAHYGLGTVLASQGKVANAIPHYEEAIRINRRLEENPARANDIRQNPSYAWAHVNLGNALAAQGQLDAAIAQYTEAIRLRPRDTLTHNNLGSALVNQGKIEEGAAHYAEALRLNPNDALTHTNLGSALTRQGKLDEAVSHYREALRVDPGYAPAHKNLGAALARQGKLKEAGAEYALALRIAPDVEAHYNLAVVLTLEGNTEGATRHLEAALKLDPGFQPARAALQKLGAPAAK